jgi:Flp pilus assembly pilin Flp
MLKRMWREDEGVLTFEWILLVTLLVIGVVGGLSAVRDALDTELGNIAGAIVAVDQSYSVPPPITAKVGFCAGTCNYGTAAGFAYSHTASFSCLRIGTTGGTSTVGVCP